MREVDIAITGAGLTGSLAAVMLARRGYAVTLIDPHRQYRSDFRCEKLEEHHVAALHQTGLADEILPAARGYKGVWIARLGRLCEIKPAQEYGIDYSALVNQVRALLPPTGTFLQDTVRSIALTPERQSLTLASGETISARLVVAANGLNAALLASLGMARREISRCHSMSLGFDVEPVAPQRFPFDALTYFGEAPEHRVSYLTLFPVASGMRANLFVYRDTGDAWLRRFRDDPGPALKEIMPRLHRLTGEFIVKGPAKFRPSDLYVTEKVLQPGIVLAGDAYASVCPTSGTGASKGIIDVARLCTVHIPHWLGSPGMGVGKIAEYYADPVKLRSDSQALKTSLFAKRLALTPGPVWSAYRFARFAGSCARGLATPRRVTGAIPNVTFARS